MALTEKQIYDLNNMNVAAQNAGLGDLLNSGEGGSYVLPSATTTTIGGVKQATSVALAAGENVTKEEFDALVSALKVAGIMA